MARAGKSEAPVYAVLKAGGLVPGSKRPRLWWWWRWLRAKAMRLEGLAGLRLRMDLRSTGSAPSHPLVTLVHATLFSSNGVALTSW